MGDLEAMAARARRNAEMLLTLQGDALEVATQFLQAFPEGEIISGGRDAAGQARAMASNVILNRAWILGTTPPVYRWSAGADRLHRWSLDHPTATYYEVVEGFTAIMHKLTDAERDALSKHFGRSAFDPRVMLGKRGIEAEKWLRLKATDYGGRFLNREGGLLRWHWQAK